MTLIIAGIQAGDSNSFTSEQGFCVSDGLGSIGASIQIFSAKREKINVLTPEQRISIGWLGNGYQTIGSLKSVLVAQAGSASLTGQVIAKYLAKLRALYICYRHFDTGVAAEEIARLECRGSLERVLCMRHVDDTATVRGLPTNEDLPASERDPELSMGYAAYLLARTFETTFAEILSHERV